MEFYGKMAAKEKQGCRFMESVDDIGVRE